MYKHPEINYTPQHPSLHSFASSNGKPGTRVGIGANEKAMMDRLKFVEKQQQARERNKARRKAEKKAKKAEKKAKHAKN